MSVQEEKQDTEFFANLGDIDNIHATEVLDEIKENEDVEEVEDDDEEEDMFNDDDEEEEDEDGSDDGDNSSDQVTQSSTCSSFKKEFTKKYSDKYKNTETLNNICRKEEKKQKAYLLAKLKTLSTYSKPLRQFSMDDKLRDIENEVNRIEKEREMENSLSISRQGFMFCVSTLEFFSQKQKFVDVRLNGWSKKMMIDVNENKMYDGVFLELYEKHMNGMELSPESRLIMMVLGSAFGFHMANKLTDMMFKPVDSVPRPQYQSQQQAAPQAPPQQQPQQRLSGPSIDLNDIISKMKEKSAAPRSATQQKDLEDDLQEMLHDEEEKENGQTKVVIPSYDSKKNGVQMLSSYHKEHEEHEEDENINSPFGEGEINVSESHKEEDEAQVLSPQSEAEAEAEHDPEHEHEPETELKPTDEQQPSKPAKKTRKRKPKASTLDLSIPDSFDIDISSFGGKKIRV